MTKGKVAKNSEKAVSPVNGQPVPKGRAKGTPNKATAKARLAIADFVNGNSERLTEWLDKIALKDPEAAFKAYMSVVEYHIPKLQRTTLDAGEGSEGEIIYRWKREDE